MAEVEEYKRRNEDYYQSLKDESYKAMLSKEVQASVAADQARKYTQNALNAQGLGTQGITQSTQLGIGNQYRNALFEAQNQHEQNVLGFNQQQRAEDENDYRNAVSSFNEAYSKDDLDLYMKLGGYMDANGNIRQGVPQDIVDAYNAYAGRFATAEAEQKANDAYKSIDNWNEYTDARSYAYKDGNYDNWEKTQRLQGEYRDLRDQIDNGKIQKDTYVELVSENGYHAYVYYDANGRLLILDPNQYKEAQGTKVTIGKTRQQEVTEWQQSEAAQKVPVGSYAQAKGLYWKKTKNGWIGVSEREVDKRLLFKL